MAQFTIYRSTDSSAPTVSGTAGDLVNLLDKCLVAGYGSKTAAGWSKDFTGTNKATFRAPSGNRMYLRVQDDGPGAGGAREARLTGYESMTDVDTGMAPFPTAAQGVGGVAMVVARKSSTADATTRAWIVFADARTVYVFITTGDTGYRSFCFGEFFSLLTTTDNFRTMIIGRNAENSAAAGSDNLDLMSAGFSITNGHFMARGHTGLGGSINFGTHGDHAKNGNSTLTQGIVALLNPADGGAFMSPIWIHDITTTPVNGIRGRLRGMWHFVHTFSLVGDQETFNGNFELAGKSFFAMRSPNAALYVMETSDTLEIN